MAGCIPGFKILRHEAEGQTGVSFDEESGGIPREVLFVVQSENGDDEYIEARIAELCKDAFRAGVAWARKNPNRGIR